MFILLDKVLSVPYVIVASPLLTFLIPVSDLYTQLIFAFTINLANFKIGNNLKGIIGFRIVINTEEVLVL